MSIITSIIVCVCVCVRTRACLFCFLSPGLMFSLSGLGLESSCLCLVKVLGLQAGATTLDLYSDHWY